MIITGASGVLGTAVRNAFSNASDQHYEVLSLSYSQSGEGLVQLDLTKKEDVERVFTEFKPTCELEI